MGAWAGSRARAQSSSKIGGGARPLQSSAAPWPLAHGDLPSTSVIRREVFDEFCGGKRQAGRGSVRRSRDVVDEGGQGRGFWSFGLGLAWRAGFLPFGGRVAIS